MKLHVRHSFTQNMQDLFCIHLEGIEQPIRHRHPMWQQLVDDTAMILSVLWGIFLQIMSQQPPSFICRAVWREIQFRKTQSRVHRNAYFGILTDLDSLVVIIVGNWLAASQFHTSVWSWSPLHCSLIHLQRNNAVQKSEQKAASRFWLGRDMSDRLTWRSVLQRRVWRTS